MNRLIWCCLDMKIPGWTGLEILKHIKAINQEIKVIMMTAYGELDMIKEATDLGALMHFTKPFDIDEMRMAVNMQLRGGESNQLVCDRVLIIGIFFLCFIGRL